MNTIGLCSNPAAGLVSDPSVIWPAAAAGFRPTSGRRDRAADRPRRPGKRSAADWARRRRARPSSASRILGTASGSGRAESWFFPAGTSLVPGAPRAQVDRRNCPHAPDRLTRGASHTQIRFSVMLRGWRRGGILQRLRAAGARSGRDRGPVHQAAAARPGPAIRSQEQTASPGRSDAPAAAGDATDGAVFRVRRSLGLRPSAARSSFSVSASAGTRIHRLFWQVQGPFRPPAFRISAVPPDSVEMHGRRLQIGGTKLVQCLPTNRLSKIELSLRRSSHGSAARSSMVSSSFFGGDR